MIHRISKIVAGLLLAAAFASLYYNSKLNIADPDRYYHFALSREMVQSGQFFLRSLPQVEDLGWGDFFVDKEFLFHQVTGLGYWIKGDVGAEWATVMLTITGILVFFSFAGRQLPPWSAAAVTFFAFSCPFLLARLLLLRPHVIGILGFVLMNVAVLSRRPLATALAVFFFTLSYHAFYIPLACLVFLTMLSYLDTGASAKNWRRVAAFGFFGCVCGVLANPYFPGNIDLAIIHARIPGLFSGELMGLNFGAEHTPLRSDSFFEVFHAPLLVILLAFFVIGWELRDKSSEAVERRLRMLYILGVSMLFMVLAFKTRRAGEYLAPAVGLLAIYLVAGLKKKPALMIVVPLLLALVEFSIFYRVYASENKILDDARHRATVPAIAAIPKEAKGAKVYNCEWDFSPYIFYYRPDLRFIDIMDPSLLYFRPDKGPFRARDDLRHGVLGDPHGMILNAAKAEFVLCNEPSVNAQLRQDPGFQQIYPESVSASQEGRVPSLFVVKKERIPEYVRGFRVRELGFYSAGQLPRGRNAQLQDGGIPVELAKSSYLDLAPMLAQKLRAESSDAKGKLSCAMVSPEVGEMQSRAGASMLVVGGGQGVEIWRNGKPLFRSLPAFSFNKATQVVVPLKPALRATDKLEVLVCSGAESSFWGLSLSLWTTRQLEDTCSWKSAVVKTLPGSKWEYEGLQKNTCLGPWATGPL